MMSSQLFHHYRQVESQNRPSLNRVPSYLGLILNRRLGDLAPAYNMKAPFLPNDIFPPGRHTTFELSALKYSQVQFFCLPNHIQYLPHCYEVLFDLAADREYVILLASLFSRQRDVSWNVQRGSISLKLSRNLKSILSAIPLRGKLRINPELSREMFLRKKNTWKYL